MAESIDIRELNIRIEQQSGFVTNLVTGMELVCSAMVISFWKEFPVWLRRLPSRPLPS